ncbi:Phosphomevalonate kinase [Fusarium sp. Ph1]|nr:Phosphomevalonate kinase [Fusarium sp. Ph1]
MKEDLTVPLGSRPTVGAGLWLQGGIGHLFRLHGLACDAIIGAVMVSVDSGKILCIGNVPSQHRPADAVRLDYENDLLWALKGAGTNFGIVISVTFKTHAAPTYLVRNWMPSLTFNLNLQCFLDSLNTAAKGLPRESSIDGYLFCEDNELRLGVITFEAEQIFRGPAFDPLFRPEIDSKLMNGIELFGNEMYMSKMHRGHGGGKTSSFKRCIFLKDIGDMKTADILVDVVKNRPSPLCYLHLLHGGEAVFDVAETATAFGCRDWMFACVITAVWPYDQDGAETAREAVQWVYDVAEKLLPLSAGVYGADLGPDPRDKALAAWAFGPNRTHLAKLKRRLDPGNVLAYTCPSLEAPKQKLVILVTGESGSGKDYCAGIWASVFVMSAIRARAFSISDETKREYATATGSDLGRLLSDRAYKEEHRPALTELFEDQLKKRPELLKEHFLKAMKNVADVDVLMIIGMRDEAPLVTFSPLFPDIKLIEIRVQTSQWIRRIRRGCQDDSDSSKAKDAATFTINNDMNGTEKVEAFAKRHLLPFFHEDLERLASMVPTIPDYPTPVDIRHVLNIVSSPNGLKLCTSLLKTHFVGDWAKVDAIASCEAGGFIFASPLAQQLNKPLVSIRKAEHYSTEQGIEMNPDLVSDGVSVVVVDDVLATGTTLCAVLRLLCQAGVCVENISVMVVAEFPYHGGRTFFQEHGLGGVNVQSPLVFDGA